MTKKTTFEESKKLAMENLSKQPPMTFEELKEQCERSMRESEKGFAMAAPQAQESLRMMVPPLEVWDSSRILRWLLRKQVTIEMIPKDVFEEFKKTTFYHSWLQSIQKLTKGNDLK